MNKLFKDIQIKRGVIIGSVLILFFWGIHNFDSIQGLCSWVIALVLPFLIGGAMAFIINVPMKHIEKHIFAKEKYQGKPLFQKLRRGLSYVITLILIVCVLVLGLTVIIPELVSTISEVAKALPENAAKLQRWLSENLSEDSKIVNQLQDIDWKSMSKTIVNSVSASLGTIISGSINMVGSIFSGLTTLLIAFTFSIYLLLQKENLNRQFKKAMLVLLKKERYQRAMSVLTLTQGIFEHFISGQCLEACILGFLFFLTMSILRFPYALLIGITIAITALIPILGAFIGCALGIILIGLVSPTQAIGFVILFFVLQQIEGNLIYPHVVGNSIGLPGIWVLVAVSIGGNLMGVLGMLLFIPLVSVLYSLFRTYINRKYKELGYGECMENSEGEDSAGGN